MAVMATQHPEGAVFDEKAQPVPSSEMKMMALDVKINGNTTRDDKNPVSALSNTNSPSRDLGSTNIKVNGDANMNAFFANQNAPLVEFPAGSPPTQGTSASADNPNSSPLPDTNTTTTETQHLSPDPSTLLPPADAAVESAIADMAATSTIPPIVEAQQSDLRHSSDPPLQTEVDPFTASDDAMPSLQPSIEPQAQPDSALAMDLDTGVDGGQPAEQGSHVSPDERITSAFDGPAAATSPHPSSSQLFPISPEAEVNLGTSSDSNQKSAEAAADTSMELDGIDQYNMSPPAEGSKVPRSREPDESEEPSAKRLKTDSMALDSPLVASIDETPDDDVLRHDSPIDDAPNDGAPADDVPNDHAADGRTITPYMVKELVKVIKNVARTKHGRNFKAPVAQLWPTLADQYAEKVPHPIDLQTIENKLVGNVYASLADFQSDVNLIYDNTLIFNGPNHVVTNSAQEVRDNILAKSDSIPPEPPAPVKAPKKAKRASPVAESVAPVAPAPRPSRAAATAAPPAPTFALDPTTNTPLIRRDSTKGDGRPKREIHPPKNKDLPYNSRPKNRKTSTELKFCEEALNELKKPKYTAINHPFMTAVDPVALGIPNYFSVIKNPMDLGTISSKLSNGDYARAKDFENDVRLVFSNCFKFNPEGNAVRVFGKQLEEVFDNKWSQKAQWIQDHSPAAMSPASQGHSDAESEEDEDEGGDEPTMTVPGQAALRLIEEQNKLITLMGAKKPDAFMVQLQQDMIKVIEKKVAEEKAAAMAAAARKANKKTKAAKPAKKAAPVKKAGGGAPKKQAAGRQKYMGTLEKEVISMGIAQLPDHVATQVLGWLRAEHQIDAEEDGTIEMDIELLSHATLWKIYDAVMRYIPEVEAQVRRDLSLRDAPRPSTKPAPKKKHKPMNKVEQERRIDALRDQVNLFERHGSGSQEPLPTPDPPQAESSGDEDSDSEEE